MQHILEAHLFCRYFESNLGHTIVGLAGNDNCTYIAACTSAVNGKAVLEGEVQSQHRMTGTYVLVALLLQICPGGLQGDEGRARAVRLACSVTL